MQLGWLLLIVCMGVFAFYKIRRSHFNLFYYSHHAFVVILAAALYHATSLWYSPRSGLFCKPCVARYFLLVGLIMYSLDRMLRWHRGCRRVSVLSMVARECGDSSQICDVEVTTRCSAHKLTSVCR